MTRISCVNDFFERQVQKGRWIRSLVPSYLLQSFKSRVDESIRLTGPDRDIVPPYACTFSGIPADGALVIVSDEVGQLALIDTSRRASSFVVSSWQCHSNAIFDVTWIPGERTVITASGDQTLGLHDVLTRTQTESFVGHFSSIRAVDHQKGNPHVFASASRDGSIRLWDRRNRKTVKQRGKSGLSFVACLDACHHPENGSTATPPPSRRPSRKSLQLGHENSGSHTNTEAIIKADQSVTSLSFGDNYIASSGATDGKIKLWDVRKMTCRGVAEPKYVFPYSGESRRKNIGYSYLLVDHLRSRLFSVCRDQCVYQYSLTLQSDRPVITYRGYLSSSFYIRASLSPDGQYLACGSGDNKAWIFQVNEANQSPVLLHGFNGEVTDVRWSPYDPSVIASISDDGWVRVWKMDRREIMDARHGTYWGMAELCSQPMVSNVPSPRAPRDQRSLLECGEADVGSPTVRQLNIASFLSPIGRPEGNFAHCTASGRQLHAPRKLVISPGRRVSPSARPGEEDTENDPAPKPAKESRKRGRSPDSPNNERT